MPLQKLISDTACFYAALLPNREDQRVLPSLGAQQGQEASWHLSRAGGWSGLAMLAGRTLQRASSPRGLLTHRSPHPRSRAQRVTPRCRKNIYSVPLQPCSRLCKHSIVQKVLTAASYLLEGSLSGSRPSPGHACCKHWGSRPANYSARTWEQLENPGGSGSLFTPKWRPFPPKWRPFPLLPVIPLGVSQCSALSPSHTHLKNKLCWNIYSIAILTGLKHSKILLIPSNLQHVSGGKKLHCMKMELGIISVVLRLIAVCIRPRIAYRWPHPKR